MTPILPVTSLIATLLVILLLTLSMLVSVRRVSVGKEMGDLAGAAFGDQGDLKLRRRIRAFGNFVEYAPFGLLLLAVVEHQGGSAVWLWCISAALLLGRLIHGAGMLFSSRPTLRAVGMMFTYGAFGGPAIWLAMQSMNG